MLQMQEKLKKRIRWCDATIICCFALFLTVHFVSLQIFSRISVESGAEIEAVATAYEANNIYKLIYSLQSIKFIVSYIILPASLIAYYLFMRRKVLAGKVDIDTFEFFIQFAFFALIINIVNDGAVLLGKIL